MRLLCIFFYCRAFGLPRQCTEGFCEPGIARTDQEPAGTGRNQPEHKIKNQIKIKISMFSTRAEEKKN